MSQKRLDLALDLLKPTDWNRFEKFASAFLVSDYPNLRSVSLPEGDDGRDAELYSPEGDSSIVLQYSVANDWQDKIRRTLKRIKKTLPRTKILIYVTNKIIGARIDILKKKIHADSGIYLDIHDKAYFLDRYASDENKAKVSEELAEDIVDPYLADRKVYETKGSALNGIEARAALVYLALQWEDDTREKGLTKLVFEALIRSVLRGTDADHRVARVDMHSRVLAMLPDADPVELKRLLDAALERLKKRYIRHYQKEDQFCLTYEEATRTCERLATIEIEDGHFAEDLSRVVSKVLSEKEGHQLDVSSVYSRTRRIIEKFLFSRGEIFASSLNQGQLRQVGLEDIRQIAINDLSAFPLHTEDVPVLIDSVIEVIENIFTSPTPAIQRYLRWLSDSYTLYAFLRHTPDVQAATRKMFSHGEIWLDTSILLPLFAEELLESEERRFQKMIRTAILAGLKLRITRGVVEEIERHMNRSYTCATSATVAWRGQVPFLLAAYVVHGGARSGIGKWLETFRGRERPEEDISQYLNEQFGIETQNLTDDMEKASMSLRTSVKEIWTKIHERRREQSGAESDSMMTMRLAEHDTENYVGVIQRRSQEQPSALGYSCWWITLDHMAFAIAERLQESIGIVLQSPVMSADFLMNYLALGPMRGRVSKATESHLPVSVDAGLIEHLTPELLALADKVREEAKGTPENVIRRKVRDSLDKARRRTGPISEKGLRSLTEI